MEMIISAYEKNRRASEVMSLMRYGRPLWVQDSANKIVLSGIDTDYNLYQEYFDCFKKLSFEHSLVQSTSSEKKINSFIFISFLFF